MNVLIACEESQRVCAGFRKRGHTAFSCDILPCSGGHPEWHIWGDVIKVMNGLCEFYTYNGDRHFIGDNWDLIIAHPPCTYLTVTGNRWFDVDKYGDAAIERIEKRELAIENPVGVMSTVYRKPDQIIHPWMFGDSAKKKTCLWLKGLPKLVPDNIVDPGTSDKNGCSYEASAVYARDENGKILRWNDPQTAIIRSRTFPGIARAMAEQWG